jgi:type II secretory pathway predicted ATPase ExeA
MQVAGGERGVFLPDAVARIHRFAGGIPRKINHAATLALLEGFGRDNRRIGAPVVDAIMHELEMTRVRVGEQD